MTPRAPAVTAGLDTLLDARAQASEACFAPQAQRIALLCHAMAERFARGGRLLAFGDSDVDRSDVAHVTVEFVHPVIVGKRALPALGIRVEDIGIFAEPDDMVMVFGRSKSMRAGTILAREAGCLTIAFTPVGAEWELDVPAPDPFVAQELTETLYHVLWELVHVFFEHRGLLEGRDRGSSRDSGASSFLYPFLGERESDLDAVLADVAHTVVAKSAEATALREQTLREGWPALREVAAGMRARMSAGGRLLALGNGGSATDAMDAAADWRTPPRSTGWPPRAALDLTADPAILTAVANDVGTPAIFTRQIIAHGRPQDTVLALSTSGGSENVLTALAQARKMDITTVALVGYDGGRIEAEGLADHVILTRSEHIPRIQEAQASALHALRQLIEQPSVR
ncbi:MAG: Phosphoheptose isomerase-like protein [Solirubrobacterales bacterium]|nr:Phosphoheptose isomerase-like protein [Solirubrobacterales bacterium]